MNFIRFKSNDQFVTYETAEQKAIIINIENGRYFDLNCPATVIWELLASSNGIVFSATVDSRTNLINSVELDFSVKLVSFLNTLLEEKLIIFKPLAEISDADVVFGTTVKIDLNNSTQEFVINKYSDMELFLKLDPLLVNESGAWPTVGDE